VCLSGDTEGRASWPGLLSTASVASHPVASGASRVKTGPKPFHSCESPSIANNHVSSRQVVASVCLCASRHIGREVKSIGARQDDKKVSSTASSADLSRSRSSLSAHQPRFIDQLSVAEASVKDAGCCWAIRPTPVNQPVCALCRLSGQKQFTVKSLLSTHSSVVIRGIVLRGLVCCPPRPSHRIQSLLEHHGRRLVPSRSCIQAT